MQERARRPRIGQPMSALRAPRALLTLLLALGLSGQPATRPALADPILQIELSDDKVQIDTGTVVRKWRDTAGGGFQTTSFLDKRTALEWVAPGTSDDFTITVGILDFTSSDFTLDSAERSALPNGGARVTMHLSGPALFAVDYLVDAWPGLAGFRTQTVVKALVVLPVTGYSMGELTTRFTSNITPIGQTFHSGSDWRDEDGWSPSITIGDEAPRGGRSDWRVQTQGPKGGPYEQYGNWVTARHNGGQSVFVVSQRPNLPSSRVSFAGGRVAAETDLTQDIIVTGPIESDVHVENPTPVPVRHRIATALAPLVLEPAFVGLSTHPDDEPWQHEKYLQAGGWSYPRAITFNTNNIDGDRLPYNTPGGAKDSVDKAEYLRQVAVAEQLGIETFILDDGWQLNSGDWEPDPRRFPNGFPEISADLEQRGMNLGLWMSPMSFHPDSAAFRTNPLWSCVPLGTATGLANGTPLGEAILGGSAEAGIGVWNPDAVSIGGRMIDDLQAKIERAITRDGARYFKFDFLVWLDCVNPFPTSMYRYREVFVSMIDRLHARHPEVTFQIDETNDFRMWPYESVARGPSWFQNGSPAPNILLHNLWLVAPYVPTYSIGQAAATALGTYSVDYLMAAAMLSHMTFWRDLPTLTPAQVTRTRFWTDLYKAHRDELGKMVVYPLLADPMPGTNWAALQPWNPDTHRGYVFAFRQNTNQASVSLRLRSVRADLTYRVTDVVTGAWLGTVTGTQLRAGYVVAAPTKHSARVLRIAPVA